MLQRLLIQNYALIEQLDIDFSKGLSIITGETGAGKSILLGGLSLILGQRADAQALLNKEKKCFVEGEFAIKEYALQDFFKANELDYEDKTTIRREISPEGKSRAFINDTPVNLNQLKELGSRLVDIHSQHETLTLNNSAFQLSVVDANAQHSALLGDYQHKFKAYKILQSTLNDCIASEKKFKTDLDYFKFQFNELEEAKLYSGEQEKLEQELESLNNTEDIKLNLSRSFNILNQGEVNLMTQLNEVKTLLAAIIRYNPVYEELSVRIKSCHIELKDIASELEQMEQEVSHDPKRIEEINARLNVFYQLQQKHRVNNVEELLLIQNDLSDKLYNIVSLEEKIHQLTAELNKQFVELMKVAGKISDNRKKAIPKIEKEVKNLLSEVGMPNAVLKIAHNILEQEQVNATGVDVIRFLFSANKGADFKELHKVASGGELSRLMLCIKALIAKLTALPTIIFDEIDTGVSGEIAFKVGSIMEVIAKEHQVIAITHLPQMASKGDSHFFVYKDIVKGITQSNIKKLSKEERVNEVAKMLSGEKLTDAAIQNARTLLAGE